MDKRKSALNVYSSLASRIILLIAALYVRRLLIRFIGSDVNGLNYLYTSIIGMLSVAELGVGSAIVFSMYVPIVAGDTRKVSALYCLYGRLYRIIGCVIFAGGLVTMCFLPKLIGDYESLSVNVYSTFLLTLISVVVSYLYSAKTSLIEAHKDNYITTSILTFSRLIRYGLQIAAILIWRSYTIYLFCQILDTLIVWMLTEAAVRRRFSDIISMKESADSQTLSEVSRNVRAMFMHRIGTIMVSTMDSLIISGFIGVVILGKYSNYMLIAGVVSGTIALFFTPLTSVVGHLCAENDPDKTKRYFDRFYCLNYVLGVVFFLGYYAVIDHVIRICFGPGLEVTSAVSFIITLNQFISYMRNSSLLFRNASGTFYNDRWKPIAEGIANLILSLIFVNIFPEPYRVVGVIVATIITNLTICYVVEPFVVFRNVFDRSPKPFYLRSYMYVLIFATLLVVMDHLKRSCESDIQGLLANGFISVLLSIMTFAVLAAADRGFRKEILSWLKADE